MKVYRRGEKVIIKASYSRKKIVVIQSPPLSRTQWKDFLLSVKDAEISAMNSIAKGMLNGRGGVANV